MAKSPSILLMMCDQLTASMLSVYGGPVATPNLDRLAARGVRFDNATCPTPFCSPSRASLITGLYPHTHGIRTNVNSRDYPAIARRQTVHDEGILRSDVTTDRILHAAGYRTHHYGKWHLLDDDLPYYPDMYTEHGGYAEEMFEEFAQVRKGPRDSWMDWYDWALPTTRTPAFDRAVASVPDDWQGNHYRDFLGKMGRLELPEEKTFDHRVADHTIAALEAVGDAPFSITCSFNWPHDPNVAPGAEYDAIDPADMARSPNWSHREPRFEGDLSRAIVTGLGEAGAREFLRIYTACVQFIDRQVGRVLDALEASGRAEDTVVVFTADHGDMAGGHGMVWKSTSAFYDEIARVPLILAGAGVGKQGTSDREVSLCDLMPTLLEMTGQDIPADCQGFSLVPDLTGAPVPEDDPGWRLSERLAVAPDHGRAPHPGMAGSFMLRGHGMKYVRYADGGEYLYDLLRDPGETANRAEQPEASQDLARCREALDAMLSRTHWPEAVRP